MQSYSGYLGDLAKWWSKKVDKEWDNYRKTAMRILQTEDELKNIVKLVGPEGLPDKQRLVLETARTIREAFLQQNAMDNVDTFCAPEKQAKMLKVIVEFHQLAERVISKGAPMFKVTQLPILQEIMRMKTAVENEKTSLLDDLEKRMQQSFKELEELLG